MSRLIGNLLVLLAVLLMPLGMTAPAAAAEHHGSTAMPMQHCPDQSPKQSKAGSIECTMACAAALLPANFGPHEPIAIVCAPDQPAIAQRLHGLHPETATPPPKRS